MPASTKRILCATFVLCLLLMMLSLLFNAVKLGNVSNMTSYAWIFNKTSVYKCDVDTDTIKLIETNDSILNFNTSSNEKCWSDYNISSIIRLIINEPTCYEYEYLEQHRDVLNLSYDHHTTIPYSLHVPNELFCYIKSINVFCKDLYDFNTNNTFHSNSYIICNIQSFDANASKCDSGGGSFKFYLESITDTSNNAYYIEGNVIDLFNGNYIGIIYSGYSVDSILRYNTYNLVIELEFREFNGTFACFIQEGPGIAYRIVNVKQILLEKVYTAPIKIIYNGYHNINIYSMMQRYLYQEYFINLASTYIPQIYHDHWTKKKKCYQYIKYIDDKYHDLNITYHNVLDLSFFKNKWIHFMGRSRTYHLVNAFIKLLLIKYQLNVTNDSRLIYHRAVPESHVTGDFYYFKEFNALITLRGHDHGYTPHYFNVSHHLSVFKNIKLKNIPDIFVLNKGLHSAHYMNNRQDLLDYKYEINAYIYYIIQESKLYNIKTCIFWRRTTTTHWWNKTLPMRGWAWSCRTPTRINCLNRLSDSIMNKYMNCNDDIVVKLLDDYSLSLGRKDCTRDNRHYTSGNCLNTMIYDMLFSIKRNCII